MVSGCSFVFVNLVKYMFNGTHSIFKKFRPYHEPKGIMLSNQTLLLKQWNSMGKRWKRNLILCADVFQHVLLFTKGERFCNFFSLLIQTLKIAKLHIFQHATLLVQFEVPNVFYLHCKKKY